MKKMMEVVIAIIANAFVAAAALYVFWHTRFAEQFSLPALTFSQCFTISVVFALLCQVHVSIFWIKHQ